MKRNLTEHFLNFQARKCVSFHFMNVWQGREYLVLLLYSHMYLPKQENAVFVFSFRCCYLVLNVNLADTLT